MGGCLSSNTTCVQTQQCVLKMSDQMEPRYEDRKGELLAKCVDIYDGDTFTALIVVDGRAYRRRCRCIGYDSPEMRGPHADKVKAQAARDELQSVIPNGIFLLTFEGTDKYGRLLVKFKVNRTDEWLADYMIRMGHGVAYDGGKKKVG